MAIKKKDIIEAIKEMPAMELAELVEELEEVFGVSVAAPVATVAAAGAEGEEDAEEKVSFNVILTGAGDKKIQVIKAVRSLTSLGLKEAKDVVEGVPSPVLEGVSKEEAEKAKETLDASGAAVELK